MCICHSLALPDLMYSTGSLISELSFWYQHCGYAIHLSPILHVKLLTYWKSWIRALILIFIVLFKCHSHVLQTSCTVQILVWYWRSHADIYSSTVLCHSCMPHISCTALIVWYQSSHYDISTVYMPSTWTPFLMCSVLMVWYKSSDSDFRTVYNTVYIPFPCSSGLMHSTDKLI